MLVVSHLEKITFALVWRRICLRYFLDKIHFFIWLSLWFICKTVISVKIIVNDSLISKFLNDPTFWHKNFGTLQYWAIFWQQNTIVQVQPSVSLKVISNVQTVGSTVEVRNKRHYSHLSPYFSNNTCPLRLFCTFKFVLSNWIPLDRPFRPIIYDNNRPRPRIQIEL